MPEFGWDHVTNECTRFLRLGQYQPKQACFIHCSYECRHLALKTRGGCEFDKELDVVAFKEKYRLEYEADAGKAKAELARLAAEKAEAELHSPAKALSYISSIANSREWDRLVAKSAIPNDTVQKNLGVSLETGVPPCQLGDLAKVRKRLGLAHLATVSKLYWTLFEALPKVLTEESRPGLVEDILAWTGVAREAKWVELHAGGGSGAAPPSELLQVADDDPDLNKEACQAQQQNGAVVELYGLNTRQYNHIIAKVVDDQGTDERFQVEVTGYYLYPSGLLSAVPFDDPTVQRGTAIRIKRANLRWPTTAITSVQGEDTPPTTTTTTTTTTTPSSPSLSSSSSSSSPTSHVHVPPPTPIVIDLSNSESASERADEDTQGQLERELALLKEQQRKEAQQRSEQQHQEVQVSNQRARDLDLSQRRAQEQYRGACRQQEDDCERSHRSQNDNLYQQHEQDLRRLREAGDTGRLQQRSQDQQNQMMHLHQAQQHQLQQLRKEQNRCIDRMKQEHYTNILNEKQGMLHQPTGPSHSMRQVAQQITEVERQLQAVRQRREEARWREEEVRKQEQRRRRALEQMRQDITTLQQALSAWEQKELLRAKTTIVDRRVRAWAARDGRASWETKQSELAKVYLRILRALSMGGVVNWTQNDLALLCKLLGITVLKRNTPNSLAFKRRDGDFDEERTRLPLGPGALRGLTKNGLAEACAMMLACPCPSLQLLRDEDLREDQDKTEEESRAADDIDLAALRDIPVTATLTTALRTTLQGFLRGSGVKYATLSKQLHLNEGDVKTWVMQKVSKHQPDKASLANALVFTVTALLLRWLLLSTRRGLEMYKEDFDYAPDVGRVGRLFLHWEGHLASTLDRRRQKRQAERRVHCTKCGQGARGPQGDRDQLLLCDTLTPFDREGGSDHDHGYCHRPAHGFHMSCCPVPLLRVPEGDWHCHLCVSNSHPPPGQEPLTLPLYDTVEHSSAHSEENTSTPNNPYSYSSSSSSPVHTPIPTTTTTTSSTSTNASTSTVSTTATSPVSEGGERERGEGREEGGQDGDSPMPLRSGAVREEADTGDTEAERKQDEQFGREFLWGRFTENCRDMLREHLSSEQRVEEAILLRLEGQQQALLKRHHWTREAEGGEVAETGEMLSVWSSPGRSIQEWTLPAAYRLATRIERLREELTLHRQQAHTVRQQEQHRLKHEQAIAQAQVTLEQQEQASELQDCLARTRLLLDAGLTAELCVYKRGARAGQTDLRFLAAKSPLKIKTHKAVYMDAVWASYCEWYREASPELAVLRSAHEAQERERIQRWHEERQDSVTRYQADLTVYLRVKATHDTQMAAYTDFGDKQRSLRDATARAAADNGTGLDPLISSLSCVQELCQGVPQEQLSAVFELLRIFTFLRPIRALMHQLGGQSGQGQQGQQGQEGQGEHSALNLLILQQIQHNMYTIPNPPSLPPSLSVRQPDPPRDIPYQATAMTAYPKLDEIDTTDQGFRAQLARDVGLPASSVFMVGTFTGHRCLYVKQQY
jgi:hypothetical protein